MMKILVLCAIVAMGGALQNEHFLKLKRESKALDQFESVKILKFFINGILCLHKALILFFQSSICLKSRRRDKKINKQDVQLVERTLVTNMTEKEHFPAVPKPEEIVESPLDQIVTDVRHMRFQRSDIPSFEAYRLYGEEDELSLLGRKNVIRLDDIAVRLFRAQEMSSIIAGGIRAKKKPELEIDFS
ncbi:hypothetical protein RFI_04404 [Reticulomyxa filosa]|uniref:Uncharacterized protein n=1 Tax=Reticulomyxa filosa TaxID=46433 RepID=X6P3B8_RETFI|nr:hypothetical protein RFI_04404 [Reticulomyxa filosa]|eukprot:ETO32711.1 hypothetical protein RFI_04404 [Reticulomyxa filosa]